MTDADWAYLMEQQQAQFERRTAAMKLVIPAITMHLDQLKMETDEERELVERLQNLWGIAVLEFMKENDE